MRDILLIFFSLLPIICFAQINTFYVEPIKTDVNYVAQQDSHLIVINTQTNSDKLLLFLGGTGSTTKNYLSLSNFAGNHGYDVINLSYPNNVAAASLRNSPDSLAFDEYRQEICYGTPLSTSVSVDTFNSILTRTIKLVNYLTSTYPLQSWDQYLLNQNTLDWSKITVAGHSQGGGHAAYYAKFELVDRVIMFSSPNDYSDYFSAPANWLGLSGKTPINNHFAYLSLLDEVVNFNKQLDNLQDLGLYPLYDTIHVDNSVVPYGNSHFLYTTQAPGLAILNHNSTVKLSLLNNIVWEYMFSTPVTSNTNDFTILDQPNVYPNPTNAEVHIKFENLADVIYTLRNINGQLVMTGKMTKSKHLSIDLSPYEKGIYLLTINNHTQKIVKD